MINCVHVGNLSGYARRCIEHGCYKSDRHGFEFGIYCKLAIGKCGRLLLKWLPVIPLPDTYSFL